MNFICKYISPNFFSNCANIKKNLHNDEVNVFILLSEFDRLKDKRPFKCQFTGRVISPDENGFIGIFSGIHFYIAKEVNL